MRAKPCWQSETPPFWSEDRGREAYYGGGGLEGIKTAEVPVRSGLRGGELAVQFPDVVAVEAIGSHRLKSELMVKTLCRQGFHRYSDLRFGKTLVALSIQFPDVVAVENVTLLPILLAPFGVMQIDLSVHQ